MSQPEQGNGPWGRAIRYWLDKKGWRQSDLIAAGEERGVTLTKNTLSTAFNGHDVNTATLRAIAKAFHVPLEDILISPERRQTREDLSRIIRDAVESVVVERDARRGSPTDRLDQAFEDADAADARADEKARSSSEPIRKRRGRKK